MTRGELELIEALEAEIKQLNDVADFFDQIGGDITFSGSRAVSGKEKARQLRSQIQEHRTLIQRIGASN